MRGTALRYISRGLRTGSVCQALRRAFGSEQSTCTREFKSAWTLDSCKSRRFLKSPTRRRPFLACSNLGLLQIGVCSKLINLSTLLTSPSCLAVSRRLTYHGAIAECSTGLPKLRHSEVRLCASVTDWHRIAGKTWSTALRRT